MQQSSLSKNCEIFKCFEHILFLNIKLFHIKPSVKLCGRPLIDYAINQFSKIILEYLNIELFLKLEFSKNIMNCFYLFVHIKLKKEPFMYQICLFEN